MKRLVFFPTIESHFDSFVPLLEHFRRGNHLQTDYLLLHIPSICSRPFNIEGAFPYEGIYSQKMDQIENILVEKDVFTAEGGILVVGNDAGKYTKRIIRFARRRNFSVVLMQDGWLERGNVNCPVGKFRMPFWKFFLKYIVSSNNSPFNRWFNGFIGQNADFCFVYSEFALREFVAAGVKKEKVLLAGSPRHAALKAAIRKPYSPELPENVFVFFTSPPANKYDQQMMFESIRSLIVFLENKFKGDFELHLKKHPAEDAVNYKELVSENVSVYVDSFSSLLREVRFSLVFTFNSTAILEFLLLEIPFVQLVPKSRSKFEPGYINQFPLVGDQDSFNYAFEKALLMYETDISASYFLADISKEFDSIALTVSLFLNILNESD